MIGIITICQNKTKIRVIVLWITCVGFVSFCVLLCASDVDANKVDCCLCRPCLYVVAWMIVVCLACDIVCKLEGEVSEVAV